MLTSYPQTSNDSTQTQTVTRNGQVYVLVPSKTFERIEKLTAELPALREENAVLKAKDANSEAVIAQQAKLIELKDLVIAEKDKALAASDKVIQLEREAGRLDREALHKANARVTELESKVKRANRRTVFALIGAGLTLLLGAR